MNSMKPKTVTDKA